MSRFEEALRQARARQHSTLLFVILILGATSLLIAGIVVYSFGVRVLILPEAARAAAVMRVAEGAGFVVGHTLYTLGGRPSVTLSAIGYRDQTVAVGADNTLTVRLEPLPGRVRVTVDPSDERTRWVVDGRALPPAPALDMELAAGPHQLEVSHPYYHPRRIDVSLQPAEERSLHSVLAPLIGTLSITSRPTGAAVAVNGELAGRTPLVLEKPGGRYEIAVTREGYTGVQDALEIDQSAPAATRDYRLQAEQASVELQLSPPGGVLTLNDIQVPVAAALRVAVGREHRLRYAKAGYAAEQRRFTLAPGERRAVRLSLQQSLGRVEVGSVPPAATVLVDGKVVGETPLHLQLPTKEHALTLRKDGYQQQVIAVRPDSEAVQKVAATLVQGPGAPSKAPPQVYTHKAGGKMRLFRPNEAFLMGAARYEEGQRANERVREVRLTRAFYAGVHEVSVGEYSRFRGIKGEEPALPVVDVSWRDAAAFCNWLSKEEGLAPFYDLAADGSPRFAADADGYRLLSEAEWEWLARKAGKAKRSHFVWGDEKVLSPAVANVADESARGRVKIFIPGYRDGYAAAAPIGRFKREPSGLHDMGGNVSEWVHDFYSVVPGGDGSVETDPLGAARGAEHVIKGANWRSGTRTALRVAFREGGLVGRGDLGFRLGRYLR